MWPSRSTSGLPLSLPIKVQSLRPNVCVTGWRWCCRVHLRKFLLWGHFLSHRALWTFQGDRVSAIIPHVLVRHRFRHRWNTPRIGIAHRSLVQTGTKTNYDLNNVQFLCRAFTVMHLRHSDPTFDRGLGAVHRLSKHCIDLLLGLGAVSRLNSIKFQCQKRTVC